VHVAAAVALVNTAHGTRAVAPASTLDTTPVSAYGDPHVVELSHPQLASVTGSAAAAGSDARAELLAVGDDATPDAADALATAVGVAITAAAADALAMAVDVAAAAAAADALAAAVDVAPTAAAADALAAAVDVATATAAADALAAAAADDSPVIVTASMMSPLAAVVSAPVWPDAAIRRITPLPAQ
jgi:hypothetical protein